MSAEGYCGPRGGPQGERREGARSGVAIHAVKLWGERGSCGYPHERMPYMNGRIGCSRELSMCGLFTRLGCGANVVRGGAA